MRIATARFGAAGNPLADARGSDQSRAQRAPREGEVAFKIAPNLAVTAR